MQDRRSITLRAGHLLAVSRSCARAVRARPTRLRVGRRRPLAFSRDCRALVQLLLQHELRSISPCHSHRSRRSHHAREHHSDCFHDISHQLGMCRLTLVITFTVAAEIDTPAIVRPFTTRCDRLLKAPFPTRAPDRAGAPGFGNPSPAWQLPRAALQDAVPRSASPH